MTAGALAFWRKHAVGRPTIAYAVSVDHAHNLVAVFNDAGIPAAAIVTDTSQEERNRAIAEFREGGIRVLVNVLVATEGFDLPDASCIIIARPTMSLALYLQMVGRGLRPKSDGGNCLILDLAANSTIHGLAEDKRKWSLEPRGAQQFGDSPVVRCPSCEAGSPAASHQCPVCGYSFGKECDRCGRWRAHKHWRYENHCGDDHQFVCDLCHIDAHIQAHLPVAPPLDELVDVNYPEDEMGFPSDVEIDDILADQLSALFGELLDVERQSIAGADGARRDKLLLLIEQRETVLEDEHKLGDLFDEYVAALPEPERPENPVQDRRMFNRWEDGLRADLARWRDEIHELDNRPIDNQAIFESARNKSMYLLTRQARAYGLLTKTTTMPRNGKRNNVTRENPIPEPNSLRYYIDSRRKGVCARCDVYSKRRVIVLAGSKAAKDASPSMGKHNAALRRELVDEKILVSIGDQLTFARNYEFKSPSAAASVILGISANGWINLKDKNGNTLKSNDSPGPVE